MMLQSGIGIMGATTADLFQCRLWNPYILRKSSIYGASMWAIQVMDLTTISQDALVPCIENLQQYTGLHALVLAHFD